MKKLLEVDDTLMPSLYDEQEKGYKKFSKIKKDFEKQIVKAAEKIAIKHNIKTSQVLGIFGHKPDGSSR